MSNDELEKNPLGSITEPLSPEQLELRKRIAQEKEELIKDTDWFKKRPKNVKEAYKNYPMWKFYTDKETKTAVYRVYGVCEYEDGNCGLHVVSAHLLLNNDVIGGVPLDHVEFIDDWSDKQKIKISLCPSPEAFYDPLGWIMLVHD